MGILNWFRKEKSEDIMGNSIVNAIVIEGVAKVAISIGRSIGFMGVVKEYWYLTEMFGKKGVNWDLETQETMKIGDKQYDKMNIKLSDGTRKSIYFDTTSFYGL